MIGAETEKSIIDVFYWKAEELGIEIIEANGTSDHIHVLVRSKPGIAPADIAKNLKGASSHFVNHVVCQTPIHSFYWQDGYGVMSVSPGAVRSIQKYIRAQKAHHHGEPQKDELEITSDSAEGTS